MEELGQPYEHEIVGGIYGGKDKKEYASKTPTKLVPVLEDGDIALWESERFYPAFQFVIWGGKTATEALNAALIDVAGEA